uniref:Uncharacterized protein n=1 Tax=Acrobeloides nanus TaxID=290746 RepID=A0A914DGB6_9BILA
MTKIDTTIPITPKGIKMYKLSKPN